MQRLEYLLQFLFYLCYCSHLMKTDGWMVDCISEIFNIDNFIYSKLQWIHARYIINPFNADTVKALHFAILV